MLRIKRMAWVQYIVFFKGVVIWLGGREPKSVFSFWFGTIEPIKTENFSVSCSQPSRLEHGKSKGEESIVTRI